MLKTIRSRPVPAAQLLSELVLLLLAFSIEPRRLHSEEFPESSRVLTVMIPIAPVAPISLDSNAPMSQATPLLSSASGRGAPRWSVARQLGNGIASIAGLPAWS